MKRVAVLLCAMLAWGSGSAHAVEPSAEVKALTPEAEQQLAAELGQCFALKSTGEDRLTLARWFVAALGSAPQTADVAKVDPAQKDKLDRQVAVIFTRLMTVDCAEQSRPLFQARSSAGFRAAGGTLGRLAMQELMGDPKTASAMLGGYTSYLREEDFADLVK
ncbi:hypothetical protein [Novosphingobium mangrovi (ex Huang et al. 2023)]|uniref:Uncharacterized protein n=1 Tax=Novosphingobium mangrovi (ex Huang et al. 2023) TaxID=2976432 RepID=A0ABT2I7Q6_9SPHN|nr:hypothetical protein [Novosphingobium mangrovi (ex Huang et al. 2023)]MCT2400850.1 hypothetical protein [Novosphingobium mangrovi (ex Huang et al. 2023)]